MQPGATLADAKGETRLRKLIERRQHLEDSIKVMQDQHYIIESEIAELMKTVNK